jgi:hypothetical protein
VVSTGSGPLGAALLRQLEQTPQLRVVSVSAPAALLTQVERGNLALLFGVDWGQPAGVAAVVILFALVAAGAGILPQLSVLAAYTAVLLTLAAWRLRRVLSGYRDVSCTAQIADVSESNRRRWVRSWVKSPAPAAATASLAAAASLLSRTPRKMPMPGPAVLPGPPPVTARTAASTSARIASVAWVTSATVSHGRGASGV